MKQVEIAMALAFSALLSTVCSAGAALPAAEAKTGLAGELTVEDLKKPGPAPREAVYRTVGERKLRLFIYEPQGPKAEDRRPVVVAIHGGGWGAGDPNLFTHYCRYFASRGAVAVNVEYRLCPPEGVGQQPKTLPANTTTIRDCIADCKAAIRYLRANADTLGIDPNRIAVAGDSAGGHLAACLGLLPDLDAPDDNKLVNSRADALLLYNPCIDLAALGWMKKHKGLLPQAGATAPAEQTWEDRARLVSPIQYVRNGLPPMLLVHGTKDVTVPVEQIDRFAKAVTDAGNRCDYLRMEGWRHAFVLTVGSATEHTVSTTLWETDRFLRSLGYLQGEPTILKVEAPATLPATGPASH